MIKSLRFYFPVLIISIVFSIASFHIIKGGFVNPELYDRIPQLLSSKTVAERIFDPKVMDYDMYQARELSYLADQVDVAVIFELIQRGLPNMISIMHYVLGMLAVLTLYAFCRRDLDLGIITSFLMTIFIWTSPCIIFGGNYARSAKIGATAFLVMVFVVTHRMLKATRSGGKIGLSQQLILAFLAFLMTLWDRQGFFTGISLLVFLSVVGMMNRDKEIWKMILAVVISLGASTFYNLLFAPYIIHRISGYWPDFSYQKLPWGEIGKNYNFYFRDGVHLLINAVYYNLGNSMSWIFPCGMIAILTYTLKSLFLSKECLKESFYPLSIYIGLIFVGILMPIMMNSLMRARFGGVDIEVYQFLYYPLLTTFLWICMLTLGLSEIRHHFTLGVWIAPILCFLLIFGNLRAYPENLDKYLNGYFQHFMKPSASFFVGLKELYQGKSPSNQLLCQDPLFKLFARRMHHPLADNIPEKRFIPY